MPTFKGYRRPDGRVGVRNYIGVLSTVSCADPVTQQIANAVEGAVALVHGLGCTRVPEKDVHARCLGEIGAHPNLYGCIVVSLGCESVPTDKILDRIQASGKPTAFIRIEDMGTPKAISKGIEIAMQMAQEAAFMEREEFPVSDLILGTECGGSDALSGVTANPTIGLLSDWVVENGGTSILTEITELIGCNEILKARAKNEQVAKDIDRVIAEANEAAKRVLGGDAARAIAPGNMDGGMTTIQEKAMGCVRKGGSSIVNEVVEYGQPATEKGLVIMDGPGYDVESIGGMAAMGAQIIIFSTGRGNVIGFPIIPVIKVASNPDMYRIMKDNMDFNAGRLLEDDYSFEDARKDISKLFCDVANGQQTKSELHNCGGLVCLWSWSKSL